VESAKEKASNKAKDKAAQAAKAAEDADWAAAGEGSKSKAQKKKAESDSARADALAKKKEAKALADAEEAEMSSYGKKKEKKPASKKMTAAERAAVLEKVNQRQQEEQRQRDKDARRERSLSDYERLVDVEIKNRDDSLVEATGVDAAIAVMDSMSITSATQLPPDRKAEYEKFRDSRMAQLKEEKPGLKASQYQDMLWKEWQKEWKKSQGR